MSKLNICDKDGNTKSIDLDNIGLPKKVVSEQILNAAPGNSGTIEITESGYYYIEMKGGIGGKSALGQLGGYGEKIGRIELLMPGTYNYIVATNGGNSSNLYSSGSAGSGYKLVGGNGQGSFDITYTYSGAGSMESITRSFPGSGGGWQSNVYGYVGVHNEYTFKSIANKSTPPGLGGAHRHEILQFTGNHCFGIGNMYSPEYGNGRMLVLNYGNDSWNKFSRAYYMRGSDSGEDCLSNVPDHVHSGITGACNGENSSVTHFHKIGNTGEKTTHGKQVDFNYIIKY